jgi:hypothetical protein
LVLTFSQNVKYPDDMKRYDMLAVFMSIQ